MLHCAHNLPKILMLCAAVRCVQGYAGSEGAAARRANSATADLEAGGVVGRYMGEYEKSVNPFTGGLRLAASDQTRARQ
jgi:hypothetical protein